MIKKARKMKKKQEITFDYLRWLSIGFALASVGIAIAAILFVVTSFHR